MKIAQKTINPKHERSQVIFHQRESQKVIITDINMKFTSMVRFMIKWSFATVPAVIIIITMTIAGIWLSTYAFQGMSTFVEWIIEIVPHLQRMW